MKLKLFLFMLMAGFIFAGCGKDEDKTKIATKELSVKTGETSQIVVEPTNEGCLYSSENEIIATVSQTGIIKGIKVGETYIKVSNAETGLNDKCKVTVAGQSQMYREPYMKFGASMSEIKSFETRKMISETSTSIGFVGENANIAMAMYSLKNNKLEFSSVLIPYSTLNINLLSDFISERYIVGVVDDNLLFMSPDQKVGGSISTYTNSGINYYIVIYTANTPDAKSSSNSTLEKTEAYKNVVTDYLKSL